MRGTAVDYEEHAGWLMHDSKPGAASSPLIEPLFAHGGQWRWGAIVSEPGENCRLAPGKAASRPFPPGSENFPPTLPRTSLQLLSRTGPLGG